MLTWTGHFYLRASLLAEEVPDEAGNAADAFFDRLAVVPALPGL